MFQNQTSFYSGKVRDVYTIGQDKIILHASNRISAFDHILPREIPHKGQVLNQMAIYFLQNTKDIIDNWFLNSPFSNLSIGRNCETIPIEVVVRGNLTGHALRTYKSGLRTLCGVPLPDGMLDNQYFEKPIITPSTKAHQGHDEDISREEILKRNIISEKDYSYIENVALQLFERGREMAQKVGLILVDTKYEFGRIGDKIYLIDEIHTPDSSRYFEELGFDAKVKNNIPPDQLSKEFVREWLMTNGFQGLEGQKMPQMNDDIVKEISERYIHLYERITSTKFVPQTEFSNQFDEVNLILDDL